MDRNLALEFVRVTEAAAIEAAKWIGKGDKNAADKAATEAMRSRFNSVSMNGTVVIGEGERDEAPMLYIGEKVGNGKGMEVDIAVDPLECTNSVAFGLLNAIFSICRRAARNPAARTGYVHGKDFRRPKSQRFSPSRQAG